MKVSLILFLLVYEFASAQSPWVLQKEKDGIRISSRQAVKSSFNDVRVEADFPGTAEQLSGILTNIPGYTDWAYATKKSVLIKRTSADEFIYYSEISVPWPATNRFFYADFKLKKDSQNKSFQIISESIPNYQPVPKDLVAVPFSRGIWNVKTISAKKIHIDYLLELDPGGSLPSWILNLFSTRGPMETFENIRQKMISLNP